MIEAAGRERRSIYRKRAIRDLACGIPMTAACVFIFIVFGLLMERGVARLTGTGIVLVVGAAAVGATLIIRGSVRLFRAGSDEKGVDALEDEF